MKYFLCLLLVIIGIGPAIAGPGASPNPLKYYYDNNKTCYCYNPTIQQWTACTCKGTCYCFTYNQQSKSFYWNVCWGPRQEIGQLQGKMSILEQQRLNQPVPAPIQIPAPATTDPAVIALLQQIIANQQQILSILNRQALAPTPAPIQTPAPAPAPQIIVVPPNQGPIPQQLSPSTPIPQQLNPATPIVQILSPSTPIPQILSPSIPIPQQLSPATPIPQTLTPIPPNGIPQQLSPSNPVPQGIQQLNPQGSLRTDRFGTLVKKYK